MNRVSAFFVAQLSPSLNEKLILQFADACKPPPRIRQRNSQALAVSIREHLLSRATLLNTNCFSHAQNHKDMKLTFHIIDGNKPPGIYPLSPGATNRLMTSFCQPDPRNWVCSCNVMESRNRYYLGWKQHCDRYCYFGNEAQVYQEETTTRGVGCYMEQPRSNRSGQGNSNHSSGNRSAKLPG